MSRHGRPRGGRDERAYGDTNLFIALFAGAEHPLHDASLTLFRRVADGGLRLIVTPIIMAELVYVAESALAWSRATTARQFTELIGADGLEVVEAPVLGRALELYAAHRRLDFADAYLAASALESGPPRVASLDTDFDRISGVQRIAS